MQKMTDRNFGQAYLENYIINHFEILYACLLYLFVSMTFRYFSATTAKKDQTSTTIDTMKDKWPTQEVDQDQLAINRQKTYIYFLRK